MKRKIWVFGKLGVFGLGLTFFVAGCHLFEKDKVPLEGERHPISLLEDLSLSVKGTTPPILLSQPRAVPSWEQPDCFSSHDVGHVAFTPSTPTPQVLWSQHYSSADSEARLLSKPIVTSQGIFVLDHHGRIFCLDNQTGSVKWKVSIAPENKEGDPTLGGGCAYHAGTVFVASAHGELFALDATSGDALWRKPLQSPCRSAPAIADGRVYLLTLQNQLQVFDAKTGQLLWTHAGIPEGLGILGLAVPAIADDIVVVTYTSGEVCALRAKTGSPLWSEIISGPRRLGEAQNVPHIRANPVIHDNILYVLSYSGQMAAFHLHNGHRLWEVVVGGFQPPVCDGQALFVVTNNQELAAFDRKTGQVLWAHPLAKITCKKGQSSLDTSSRWLGPLLAGGVLYLLSEEGQLTPFDPKTGRPLPSGALDLKDNFLLSPLVAEGVLYALSESGRLYAVR